MNTQCGYIKLYRKALHSPMWENPNLWRFWTWCLLKAEYQSTTTLVKYKAVALLPGQFIFGRRMAQKETGLSEQTVKTCVRTLSEGDDPAITIQTTHTYSIITILKWESYQRKNEAANPQVTREVTNLQPTGNPLLTPYNKEEEVKKPESQEERKKENPGVAAPVARGDGVAILSDAKPPGFSNSSFSAFRLAGLPGCGELQFDTLTYSQLYGVFKDLFIENGVTGPRELGTKAKKCGVTPFRWAMLFLDKVAYAHELIDGIPRHEQDDSDPVALTVSGFQYGHSPTDSASALLREILTDKVNSPDGRGKRYAHLNGEFIAAELAKRKGRKVRA